MAAPVISGVTPSPGTPLEALQSVQFDVTDDSGLFRRILVMMTLADTGVTEVVHDGTGFRGLYQLTSSREAIVDGFRYLVLRDGGWTGTPTLEIVAIDQTGAEATEP